jgi:hypothetical protein
MGKVIATRIRGMNLPAKVCLVLICTLLTTLFMYEGWYQARNALATVTTFATAGTSTWVAPAGVTAITVECWGGGGAGGATAVNGRAGGGAGGQYSSKVVGVTPGNSYAVVVGAGGTGGAGNGPAGGDSTFDATGVVAKGGTGGTSGANGAGGAGSSVGGVGDLVYAGGSGAAGATSTGGGGGGGAGSTGVGGDASTTALTAGTGTANGGGNGGASPASQGTGGSGATAGGGGGGGYRSSSSTRNGGSGALGKVVITYTMNPTVPGTASVTGISSSSISLTMPYNNDDNGNNNVVVQWQIAGSGLWDNSSNTISHAASPYTYTITGLSPNTAYDVRVTFNDADNVPSSISQTLTSVRTSVISQTLAWTKAYDSTNLVNSGFTVAVPSGSPRAMVVGITANVSSSAAVTDPTLVQYGGVSLVKAAGTGTLSGRAHTWLYYLPENDVMDGAPHSVDVTFGTISNLTNISVYVAAFSGVDPINPISAFGNSSSTSSSSTATLSSAMTVNAYEQAIYISSIYNQGGGVVPSYAINSNWISGASNSGLEWKIEVANRNQIGFGSTTDNAVTGTITPSCRYSMSALSLNEYVTPPPGTTLGNGIVAASTTVSPASTVKLNGFALVNSKSGSDLVTGLTVTTTNGAATIASMQITNEAGTQAYFAPLTTPATGETWTFSGGTPIPVTLLNKPYKVLVTYKNRADLPVGSTATTAVVSGFTSSDPDTFTTNTVQGTVTVNTVQPGAASAVAQSVNTVTWTRSSNSDNVLVIRYAVDGDTTMPVDGTLYTVGNSFGVGGTVAFAGSANSFTETVGGVSYYRVIEYTTYLAYATSAASGGPFAFVGATSMTPSALAQGVTQSITITGKGFTGVTWISFSSSSTVGITVSSFTVASDTQINATIYINPGVAVGSRSLIVSNATGQTSTLANALSVTAAPTVASATTSPATGAQGVNGLAVTVTGTGFQNGAALSFSGSGITVNGTQFNNSGSLTANINIAAGAELGARDVTVINPDFGSATGADKFTIVAPLYTVPAPLTFPAATADSITVMAPYVGDTDNDNSCTIQWGISYGSYPNSASAVKVAGGYQATVSGLAAGNDGDGKRYYFQATFTDPDNNGPITVAGTSTTIASKLTHNSQNTNSTKYAQGWGLADSKYGAFTCSTCHSRTTTNARLVTTGIKAPAGETWGYPGYSSATVFFKKKSTDLGSDTAHETSTRICEVCHSQTRHNLYNNPGSNHANIQGITDCTVCHTHATGFQFDGATAGCQGCHGNPPATAVHSVAVANNCTPCHNNVTSNNLFINPSLHANGSINVGFGCVSCHENPIIRTKGRPGTQLADVVAEFNNAWSHKRSAGGNVTDEDCVVCHLEGDTTTRTLSSKHADGNIDLRDPSGATTEAAITDISGSVFTFQRFSTSYAPGTRTTNGHLSNAIDNVITQKFCLKCHNANGATNPGARVTGGTQYKPFNTTIVGAGYVPPLSAGVAGGVIDIDRQVSATNASAHPVKGPRYNSFASMSSATPAIGTNALNRNRMYAPYGVIKNRGVTGQPGVVINCFDCHNQPGAPLTLRTVTAHGAANTLRGVATNNSNSAATAVTLCIVCHAGYNTVAGTSSATANHGAGSALNSNTNTSMGNYLKYSCNYCHSSGITTQRPYRGEDMHGFDRFINNNADAMWPIGPVDTYKPFAFMRNTLGWTVTSWKPLSGPNVPVGTATCGGQSVSQPGCTGENHSAYTPGGSY